MLRGPSQIKDMRIYIDYRGSGGQCRAGGAFCQHGAPFFDESRKSAEMPVYNSNIGYLDTNA